MLPVSFFNRHGLNRWRQINVCWTGWAILTKLDVCIAWPSRRRRRGCWLSRRSGRSQQWPSRPRYKARGRLWSNCAHAKLPLAWEAAELSLAALRGSRSGCAFERPQPANFIFVRVARKLDVHLEIPRQGLTILTRLHVVIKKSPSHTDPDDIKPPSHGFTKDRSDVSRGHPLGLPRYASRSAPARGPRDTPPTPTPPTPAVTRGISRSSPG